jgi:hypothetical protein
MRLPIISGVLERKRHKHALAAINPESRKMFERHGCHRWASNAEAECRFPICACAPDRWQSRVLHGEGDA